MRCLTGSIPIAATKASGDGPFGPGSHGTSASIAITTSASATLRLPANNGWFIGND